MVIYNENNAKIGIYLIYYRNYITIIMIIYH